MVIYVKQYSSRSPNRSLTIHTSTLYDTEVNSNRVYSVQQKQYSSILLLLL